MTNRLFYITKRDFSDKNVVLYFYILDMDLLYHIISEDVHF